MHLPNPSKVLLLQILRANGVLTLDGSHLPPSLPLSSSHQSHTLRNILVVIAMLLWVFLSLILKRYETYFFLPLINLMLCDVLIQAEGKNTLCLLGTHSCLPERLKSVASAGKTCHLFSLFMTSGGETFLPPKTQSQQKYVRIPDLLSAICHLQY